MFQHGPMPMYSTRVLSVAWEMWERHSWWVPYLNGKPYSDKPPLLFWLIELGWAVGGVGDVWPRCLEMMLGAGQLLLTATLASRLFGEQKNVAYSAPWILFAFSYGFLFGLQVMYEVLLANCVLTALLALVPHARRAAPRWHWFALALSAGLLAKGPVMLLHVMPVWLLGPTWNEWARREPKRWYAGGTVAWVVSLGVLAVWALPAASFGGATYREQLLFHQTSGRVVESFAHALPFWWYLLILPALVFPFSLWPATWVALVKLKYSDGADVRFLLAWLMPVFLFFSLISGKQPYYLLPEYAGFALLIAVALGRMATHRDDIASRCWLAPWPLVLASVIFGVALIALPRLIDHGVLIDSRLLPLRPYGVAFGIVFVLLGLLVLPGPHVLQRVSVASLAGTLAASLLFGLAYWPAYDFAPAARVLAAAEHEGRPIANLETYDGQFHFLGRLTKPIDSLLGGQHALAWARAHPTGVVIVYLRHPDAADMRGALYAKPFRGVWLMIWPAERLLGGPTVDALSSGSSPDH